MFSRNGFYLKLFGNIVEDITDDTEMTKTLSHFYLNITQQKDPNSPKNLETKGPQKSVTTAQKGDCQDTGDVKEKHLFSL